MAHGDLDTAERAFTDAAPVPGDPVRASVAVSFAERVRRLREKRAQAVAMRRAPRPRPCGRPRHCAPPPVPASERSQRTALIGISSLLGATVFGWALPAGLMSTAESPRRFLGVVHAHHRRLVPDPVFRDPRPARDRGSSRSSPSTAAPAAPGTGCCWERCSPATSLPIATSAAWSRAVLLGSVAELTGGYLLAGYTRMSSGQTHTIAALGDLGLLWGVGLGLRPAPQPARQHRPAGAGHGLRHR